MPTHDAAEEAPLRTHRGAVAREQIVRAAAHIVFSSGVVGTSIEQVLTASNASRSQLHRYFANKEAVIEAVIDFQVNPVLARQQSLLARVDSVSGLREWADAFVAMNRTRNGVGLCPIGALVGQLADQSSAARTKLEDAFRTWESYLAAALRRMQERGELDAAADITELGTGVMAALQGGLVLAHAGRSEQPVRTALALAVDRVALAAAPAGHVELRSGEGS
ncbi:TetR/AcrR family transcriptional regulator [Pseudonocardia yunnanensis]|uniref:TetR/AcrR family transcriptional regulator n=1 Tax=Pseudonocardia yunnanensis TaxID=58107 RepID=A0ABW4FBN9_9PSEU